MNEGEFDVQKAPTEEFPTPLLFRAEMAPIESFDALVDLLKKYELFTVADSVNELKNELHKLIEGKGIIEVDSQIYKRHGGEIVGENVKAEHQVKDLNYVLENILEGNDLFKGSYFSTTDEETNKELREKLREFIGREVKEKLKSAD